MELCETMKSDYEVVAVNYWKDVKTELKRVLSDPWNTLLLIHNSVEFNQITNFLNKLPYSKRITYISLTKTHDSIKPYLNELKAEMSVVDCVSITIFERENTKNCIFESPPSNLKELMELIDKYESKFNPDFIVLDSLSQFIDFSSLSHSGDKEFNNFLNYFKNKNSTNLSKFVILYDDNLSKEFKNLPSYYMDIILKLDVIEDKIRWV